MALTPQECKDEGLRRSSFPSSKGGAWLVERISDGWVDLMTADMNWTNRVPIDRLNMMADELNEIEQAGKSA